MKKKFMVMLIAVMLLCGVFATVASASDDNGDGFHDGDVQKILELASQSSTLNYSSSDDPGSWIEVTWNTDTPKRIKEIGWTSKGFTGSFNVDGLSELVSLALNYNSISSLDVSGAPKLEQLLCEQNMLSSLDYKQLKNLKEVDFANNQFSTLDFSGMNTLTSINCTSNPITSIDLSGCTALEVLLCDDTQLTSLDVTPCSSLTRLDCNRCLLTSLDLSVSTALEELLCQETPIASIDFSACTALKRLILKSDTMLSLDVSACTALEELGCSCPLTSLKYNAGLKKMGIQDTQLTLLNLGTLDSTAQIQLSGNNKLQSISGVLGSTSFNFTAHGNGCINLMGAGEFIIADAQACDGVGFIDWTDSTDTQYSTNRQIGTFNGGYFEYTANFEWLAAFDSNGGDTEADPASVGAVSGSTISAPSTPPTREYYTFDGWYKESSCNNAWNFATDTVTNNTTLYAKWTPVDCMVTFNSQGGSDVAPITAAYGSTINAPAAPAKDCYTFDGWYKTPACDGEKVQFPYTVNGNTELYAKWQPVHVTSVLYYVQELTIPINVHLYVGAEVYPENAAFPELTYKSSDERIATVDESGDIFTVGVGSVVISATADGITDELHLIIEPNPVESITLSADSERLFLGETITLSATVLPDYATYPQVVWSSDDETIAVVDANGKVTAVGEGSTSIKATADGVSAKCTVTVQAVPEQRITVMGRLLDDNEKPLAGYTVELHSTPRTTVTDSHGRYTFANVEIADHSLIVKDTAGETLKSFAVSVASGDDFSWNKPNDDTIKAVVQEDTASINVTINIANDGTVTVDDIQNVVNPKTGGEGQQVWLWAFGIVDVLIICAVLIWRKRTCVNPK